MTQIQQHALDAIVKNQVRHAHVVTNVSRVVIEYTAPDGSRQQVSIGDDDCVILHLNHKSKQPPGVYEVTSQ